jgi:1-aminocyclopropane-1-carboxylate deaminase/D-cysteine desulfhydrase-like pyridoxal-dependent ACC family enzyme
MSLADRALGTDELRRAVARLPRVSLGHFPTPLEPAPRLSQAIGGPPVYVKRDDCTGLAFGGNKTRHNEFLLAHAMSLDADLLVWGAGVQSNNCRQTAAACARLGLDCHLVLTRAAHGDDVQGNLLLDQLLGATIQLVDVPIGPPLNEMIAAEAERFRKQGRKVYFWDNEVVKPRAALSYALCMAEIADQAQQLEIEPSAIYVSSAGSTGAGVALGKAALGWDLSARIVAPIHWHYDHRQDLAATANRAAELAGLSVRLDASEIESNESYLGPGYGIPSPEGLAAMELMARTEGVLLDPVYTGKALAALIDDVRQGRLPADRPVVFIHTGGTPALFAYRDELVAGIPARRL